MEGLSWSEDGGLRREKVGIIRGRPRKVSSPPGERSSALKAHVRSHSLEILLYLTKSFELSGEGREGRLKALTVRTWRDSDGMPRWRLFLKRVSNELKSPSSKSFLSFFLPFFFSSFSIVDSHRPFPLSLFRLPGTWGMFHETGIENPWILSTEEMQDSLFDSSSERALISRWRGRWPRLIAILFESRGMNNIRGNLISIIGVSFFFFSLFPSTFKVNKIPIYSLRSTVLLILRTGNWKWNIQETRNENPRCKMRRVKLE